MKTLVRVDKLNFKRLDSRRSGSFESNGWQQCSVALFRDDADAYWLAVFCDSSQLNVFFATDQSDACSSLSSGSPAELSAALPTGNAATTSQLRGVLEIVALASVIRIESSRVVEENGSEEFHCLSITCSSLDNSRMAGGKRQFQISCNDAKLMARWSAALEMCREQLDCDTTEGKARFTVQLIALPEACPIELHLQLGSRYVLQVQQVSFSLFRPGESTPVVEWPFTLIRSFFKLSNSHRDEFRFVFGRKSHTGPGEVCLLTPYAPQLDQSVHDSIGRFKQRRQEAMNDSKTTIDRLPASVTAQQGVFRKLAEDFQKNGVLLRNSGQTNAEKCQSPTTDDFPALHIADSSSDATNKSSDGDDVAIKPPRTARGRGPPPPPRPRNKV